MDTFKVPQNIPQDLLLIHDIIGVLAPELPPPPSIKSQKVVQLAEDDSIDSSDSEIASEDEIEADLIPVHDEDENSKPMYIYTLSALHIAYL